jgi:hypothetical protein
MARGQAALQARRGTEAARFFQEALNEAPGDPPATLALRQALVLPR